MHDDPGNTSTSGASGAAPPRGVAAAMTALAVAYPVVTTWYFWADWFRFLEFGGPTSVTPAGVLIPFGSMGEATILSPWRLVVAGISAAMLGSAARRLWKRTPDAPAYTMLTLWGVLLPQLFWYFEFIFDWRAGRGFGSILLAALAMAVVPTWLFLRKGANALAGWGKLAAGRGRVLAGTAALGWGTLAAMTFLDHSDMFRDAGLSFTAALATLPLAALGMVGLWRQRTWGLLAAGGAVASLSAMVYGMADAAYSPMGRAIDGATAAVSASWAHTAVGMIAPVAVLTALLSPFVSGLAKRLAGAPLEPATSYGGASAYGDAAWSGTRARIATTVEPTAHEAHEPGHTEIAAEEEAAELDAAPQQRRLG